MAEQATVQEQSNMVAAASASLCFKNNALTGIILSTRDVIKDNDEVDVVDGKILFVGYKSVGKQFEDETSMVRFVHHNHPKFDMIVDAARKLGIITNELK